MANSGFLFDDLVKTATLAASGSASGTMGVANLATEQRTEFWRSPAGVSSYVTVTLGSDTGIDHVALVDPNLTTAGTFRLRGWSDALNGSALVYDQVFYPTLYIEDAGSGLDLGEGDFGDGTFGSVARASDNADNVTRVALGAMYYNLYWRIDFDDVESDYQQLGRLVMAAAVSFENNLSYGWNGDYEDPTIAHLTPGGPKYRQPRRKRLRLSGSFDLLSPAERTRMFIRLRKLGESVPFIYWVFPEGNNEGMTTTVYGCFEGRTNLGNPGPVQNTMKFTVIEEH